MVSYDEAVAIVQDPQADPVMLAKVAYENPEFGANVAAHRLPGSETLDCAVRRRARAAHGGAAGL